jgi:uncharacterized integral membrane protein (TIGR00697 family)
MKNHNRFTLLPVLMAISTGAMLIANIIAGKQFHVLGFALPCAVVVFPVTYILSDVFSEVYGYKWSRRSAWVAFGMNLFAVAAFQMTIALPGVAWFTAQEAFEVVLGNTPRILIASLLSYMLGDWVNDRVFRKMKAADAENKRFGLRAITSSFFGELTDSLIFIPLAFIGTMPVTQMLVMVGVQAGTKLVLEFLLLPATKWCVSMARRYEDAQQEMAGEAA